MIDLLDALDVFLGETMRATKERAVAKLRPGLQRDLARAFRKQGQIFVRKLSAIRDEWPVQEERTRPDDMPEAVWNWLRQYWGETEAETVEDMIGPIARSRSVALTMGGESLAQALNMSMTFDLENPLAVARVRDYGAKLVSNVNETTQGYIRTIIGNGLQDGWSYDKVARSLLDRFEEFAIGKPQEHIDSRAHLIAITEIGQAYEVGNATVADDLRQAGLPMEKSWLTSRDDRTSAGCLENQAVGWIPIEQAFPSGHMHPLRFPGCRCAALYRRVGAGL